MSTAALFSGGFAFTYAVHRKSHAAFYFSWAFLCGALSCGLFLFVPATTPVAKFMNTVVGDSLVCLFLWLLHYGIGILLGDRRLRLASWVITAATCGSLLVFTEIIDSMSARIAILAIFGCVIRAIIAMVLLQRRKRRLFLALSIVMFFFSGLSLWQGMATQISGAPADYMLTNFIQTSVLFLYLLFVVSTGVLLFLMLNDELLSRFKEEAARDFLSRTLNRRGIERVLGTELERARRRHQVVSVGLIDIDHFKRINDTDGHAAGDQAVLELAQTLMSGLRAYDSVGRYGGDEFLVIMPDTTLEDARLICEGVQLRIADSHMITLTLSIGLATRFGSEDGASMISRADEALYQAKADGRNCVRTA